MKRIMTGVILVLAVMAFSSSGVVAKDCLDKGNIIEIKSKNNKKMKFEVLFQEGTCVPIGIEEKKDNNDNDTTKTWEETDRPPITNEIISIFIENPCKVCIGSTCWMRGC